MTTAAAMDALVLNETNAPFTRASIARPEPAAGQVLVRVKASGVNPLDLKIRSGNAAHAKHPFPAILGMDLAGTIEALGAGVTGFAFGDEVYGLTGGVGGFKDRWRSLLRSMPAFLRRSPSISACARPPRSPSCSSRRGKV